MQSSVTDTKWHRCTCHPQRSVWLHPPAWRPWPPWPPSLHPLPCQSTSASHWLLLSTRASFLREKNDREAAFGFTRCCHVAAPSVSETTHLHFPPMPSRSPPIPDRCLRKGCIILFCISRVLGWALSCDSYRLPPSHWGLKPATHPVIP